MNNASHALGDYKVGKRIASGGFGFVYAGKAQDGKKVAIKYERTHSRITRPYLKHEADVYRLLEGNPCVPKVYAYGREERWNIMIFDHLGTSLETLLEKCNGKFSLKTMLMLAPQIIECIEYIHSKGIIHRDIKPDNFLMGTGDRINLVHIIDFGLSRRFRHPRTLEHFPYFEGHNFFGTTRFASLKALEGCSQSRRDDLESAAYSLVYFMRDRLPWQGLRGGTEKHRDQRVREKKRTWTPERLCEGLPGAEELIKMLHYVKSLNYTDEPDYAYLKGLFLDRFKKEGYELDYDYDWLHVVDEETDSGDGLSVTGSKIGSEARSVADRISVDSDSVDDIPTHKIPRSPTDKPAMSLICSDDKNLNADSEILLAYAAKFRKDRIASLTYSRSQGVASRVGESNGVRSGTPGSSVSKVSGDRRSRSAHFPSSSDSSLLEESLVKKGDFILVKFLARATLEKGSLRTDSNAPVDNSYWHNPELSEDEWHFPFRLALVTKVDVWDSYTRISVLPVMQRSEGLEKISRVRRPEFFMLVTDKDDATGSAKGKGNSLKLQTTPAWPLSGTYIHHPFDTFRIHVPTDAVQDIKVVWRLDKHNLENLMKARDDIANVVSDDDYLSDAGYETDEVRRQFMRRQFVVNYPLLGEIASLTEDAFQRSDVDLKGSNGWLAELLKVDRRRNHENGYYTGDSDYEDDENLSAYTGPAPGNRRLSCTLAIDGDVILEVSSQAGSDRDSRSSSRYRSPRSSEAGSYRFTGSSRRSRASSAVGPKVPRDAKSLRQAILESAVRSGFNSPAVSRSDTGSDHFGRDSASSHVDSTRASSSSLSTHASFKPGFVGSAIGSSSSGVEPTKFSTSTESKAGSSAADSSRRASALDDKCSCATSDVGSRAGSCASAARSALQALSGTFGVVNEAATAVERKIMVDNAVQTDAADLSRSSSQAKVDKAIQTEA